MARGKKKETLTPEDRLQAALVPEGEQPYKVPKNWICFRFTSLIDIEGGTQPPKSQFINEYREGYIRLVQIRDFASDKYIVFVPDTAKLKHFNEDDILIARYGASLGRICTGMSGAYNVALAKTIFSSNILNRKYVYWMLQSESFQAPLMGISRTAQAGFNKEDLSTFAMPLPPLSEQQRIVDRIESLFAKLDEAKQKAQDSLDSFETRKAAILHKAFTGELTAQWRKEHGVGMESWENVSVSEICHSLKYGTAKKSSSEGTVVVIRMGNLQDGEISWDDLAYSNDEEDIEKYKLVPGDVLFNRTNSPALVGKTSIYRGEYPAIYAGYLIKLDYDRSRIIGDYLNYSLNTVSAKEYCNSVKTDGVNQSNINAKKIGAYIFAMPQIDEQAEIVRLLDDLLIKEQQAKEAAEGVLDQIDLIKKAILARAFRGELGTNDPGEESVEELLFSKS
jgi:type I restriction enzyme S subunit